MLPLRVVARSCNRRVRSNCARAFSSARPVQSASVAVDAPQPPSSAPKRVTRTRKAFSELPKVWLKPDGTPAAPLGAWSGGLEGPNPILQESCTEYLPSTSKQVLISEAHTGSEVAEDNAAQASEAQETEHALPLGTPAKKRKPRSKKADTALTESSSVDVASSVAVEEAEQPVKKRRPRKAKIPPAEVEADAEEVDIMVTPKQKRIRKPKDVPLEDASVDADFKAPTPKRKVCGRAKAAALAGVVDAGEAQPKTPLAAEILSNLAKWPHCILLTRVGQFYESYFEQASEVSQLLNIKLTDKPWGGRRVLMCGFPVHHLDRHLKTLVQGHKRLVALCEEFLRTTQGPAGQQRTFDRRVSRIVTPGTLIDEPFLNQFENNYLLAVGDNGQDDVGLAWIDVSTGEFFAKHIPRDGLKDELARLGPKEVVLDVSLAEDKAHPVRQAVSEDGFFTSYIAAQDEVQVPEVADAQAGTDDLSTHMEPPQPSLLPPSLTPAETTAVRLLTAYLDAHLLEHMPRLGVPSRESTTGRMQIDAHTIKSLEIRESMREGGTTGSLLSVVKRTVTSGGTRLLARWLCSPSTSLKEINARQSLVAYFYSRPHLRADLVQSLSAIEDASRIVQKFLLGKGDAGDLSEFSNIVSLWSNIKDRIRLEKKMEQEEKGTVREHEWAGIDALMSRFESMQALAARINAAVTGTSTVSAEEVAENLEESEGLEVPANTGDLPKLPGLSNQWKIRPAYSAYLTRLHHHLEDCLDRRLKLEEQLQFDLDAPSLSLRWSPGLGMCVHIAKSKRDKKNLIADNRFIMLTESGTTCTFFLLEWSKLGSEIVNTTDAISAAERDAFDTLRAEVNAHEGTIRRNSRILDELDVSLAFANLAEELKFSRPTMTEEMKHEIVNGRHPTVELGLLAAGRSFTPNTLSFASDSLLHVITGPNMAGKSTLLRQTALITILAQTGSFVPAEHAEIGIVDKVFSRIGAKDDLFRDRSTFMVEMLETADILRRATPRSLVIMDEVGRGTTIEDGLAIAFATVHHLLTINQCRTLFATHFHELADMLGYTGEHRGAPPFDGVSFFCTDIAELEDGYFTYSHRLKPGVNRNSHGIKVAHLAGMPDSAVEVANTALAWLKHRKLENVHEHRVQLQTFAHNLAIAQSCK